MQRKADIWVDSLYLAKKKLNLREERREAQKHTHMEYEKVGETKFSTASQNEK